MIRLLFIPFLAILFYGCESDLKEVDPLFYQMSEADSARCMEEILDGIRLEGKENQWIIDDLFTPGIPYCDPIDRFYIGLNSSGRLMLNKQFDSVNVIEKVFEYFIFNRNLTLKETHETSMKYKSLRFNFPFYNKFTLNDIQRNTDHYQKEIEDLNVTDSSYLEHLEHLELKVTDCKKMKRALELIDEKSLPQLGTAHIVFEYPHQSEKTEEILNDAIMAFYHLRNFECMRNFNETYLSVYDRAQRINRKLDLEKLMALKVIHRPIIFHRSWENIDKPGQEKIKQK